MTSSLRFALAQSPLVQSLRDVVTRLERRSSYAQHGEDRFIFETVFARRQTGRYLDIGGSHPVRLSNTWLLYKQGWSGVVVEPISRLADLHRRWRPRDVQVEALMGEQEVTSVNVV